MKETRNLSTLLNLFADFLGLEINRTKLALVGFGVTYEEVLQCSEALGTLIGELTYEIFGSAFEEGQRRQE